MISCYASKKLLPKLPVQENGYLPELPHGLPEVQQKLAINPLSGWHASLLAISRRNCILMVHDKTRFPIIMIGLTKKEFADLDFLFADVFMNTILKSGANDAQMQAAESMLAPLNFSAKATINYSVQGTLNRMRSDIDRHMEGRQIDIMSASPSKISVWLGDRPCFIKRSPNAKKETIWPRDEMLQLLRNMSLNRTKG